MHLRQRPGAHFIELVINDNLSFDDKYSDILDFDWLWSTVAMVIVSEWQVVIDDKFYEMGPRNSCKILAQLHEIILARTVLNSGHFL